ncbi:SRPBCC domain-containing protein [Streptomyces sp. NPDC005202]|uniref:SRPBCC domain-containing protein n=1 Tax=Streptomyces sp. NPDC005202 TaxID=3157021 RepID=UPI00339F675B
MEHEVFVPVPARRLREALADPARVARAVPGLQQDAGTEPVAGRLKVRIGSHSITYRGTLRVSAHDDGSYAVEGDATESRGTGSVKLALTLRVRDSDGGSALAFDGTASADGRVAELPPATVDSAVARLLNRFAENLAAGTGESPAEPEKGTPTSETPTSAPAEPVTPESLATEDFAPLSTGDFEATPDADDAPAPAPGEAPEPPSVFETEVAPSSLDPLADSDADADAADDANAADKGKNGEDGVEGEVGEEGADVPRRPVSEDFADAPAEAAHARRTMIGRSAEEVDHAPPRGRYAPVPAPLTISTNPALRWAAPAAALVVASAIVLGRALRRRR